MKLLPVLLLRKKKEITCVRIFVHAFWGARRKRSQKRAAAAASILLPPESNKKKEIKRVRMFVHASYWELEGKETKKKEQQLR